MPKENQIKLEVLSSAYELAKKSLGENDETTKQYAQDLAGPR